MRIAAHAGVHFTACVSCADNLSVKEQLESMEIEVKLWGEPLTDLIQEGAPLLTI